MENRSGLIVQSNLTRANDHAKRRAALDMVNRRFHGSTRQLTLGADKAFDTADFVDDLEAACVTPHIARKSRHSEFDARTTRHKGYAPSIRHRKRIEETFGWARNVGGITQALCRGFERVHARLILTVAANKHARRLKLLAA